MTSYQCLLPHGCAVISVIVLLLLSLADNRTEPLGLGKCCRVDEHVYSALRLRGGTRKRTASTRPLQRKGKAAKNPPARTAAAQSDAWDLAEQAGAGEGGSDFDLDEEDIDRAARSIQDVLEQDKDKLVKIKGRQLGKDTQKEREQSILAGKPEDSPFKLNQVVKNVDARLKSSGKNNDELAQEQQELFDEIARQLREDGIDRSDFRGTQIEDITERTALRLTDDNDDVNEEEDADQGDEQANNVVAMESVRKEDPKKSPVEADDGAELERAREGRDIFEFSSDPDLDQFGNFEVEENDQVPCLDVDNEMKEGIQKGDELANELAKKFGLNLGDESSGALKRDENAPPSSDSMMPPPYENNEDTMSKTMTDGTSVPFLEGVNEEERRMGQQTFYWPKEEQNTTNDEDDFWKDCSYTFEIDEWCGEPKSEIVQPGRKPNMTDQEYWDFLEDEAERYFKYIGLDPSKLQSYGSYKDLPSVLKRGNNTSDSSDENPASSTESNANSNKVENKVEKKEKVTEQDQYKKEMESQLAPRDLIRKLEGDSSDTWVDSQGERRKRAPATIEERMTQVFTPSMMGLVPGSKKGKGVGIGKAPPITCIDDLRYRGFGLHEFEYNGIKNITPVASYKLCLEEAKGNLPKGTTGYNVSEMNFNLFDRIRYNITRDPQVTASHISSAHVRPHISAAEFLGIKNASEIPPAPAWRP